MVLGINTSMFGLHWIDISIVLAYLAATLVIGQILSHKVKGQNDFYLAGRKLGKLFQFFLNFGQMTDSSGATSTASVVYKQGVGGVWMGFQTLFMTPYYWFMNVWFRRVRLITVADLFEDRFGGKFLSGLYALFIICQSIGMIGWGNLVACKTLQPIMVKSPSEYTASEQKMVADFNDFVILREQSIAGTLPSNQKQRYEILKSLYERNQLNSYVSYLHPLTFYIASGSIVAIYIILGGLTAAAIIDAVQALLTIAFSVTLIPFGLAKLGGFSGLHERIPDYMFQLFGSGANSEYTWYSILAFLFASIVQINAQHNNMGISGSAKNELAARFGAVGGGFGKRFIIIAWTLCALIALGLYGNSLGDPDNAWGHLTRDLLPVGAIGVMLAGILAGKMAALGASAITLSALFVRNLYLPFWPKASDKHCVLIGRIVIAAVLICGILIATVMTGVISLLKVLITMNVTFGASIVLIFFWRRLTKTAVVLQVIICVLFIVVIPWIIPLIPQLKKHPMLVEQTIGRISTVEVRAVQEDVTKGLASAKGEILKKQVHVEPVSIYWDAVAHADPHDVNSPMEGIGRFHTEILLADTIGIDVKHISPAGLMTIRFIVDGILPFVLLFIFSYITTPTDKTRCDRFYVRMKTPIGATLEIDAAEIEKSYAEPHRFDHLKLFTRSNWEMCKWDKQDTVGFLLCWVMVALILGVFLFLLNIGR